MAEGLLWKQEASGKWTSAKRDDPRGYAKKVKTNLLVPVLLCGTTEDRSTPRPSHAPQVKDSRMPFVACVQASHAKSNTSSIMLQTDDLG